MTRDAILQAKAAAQTFVRSADLALAVLQAQRDGKPEPWHSFIVGTKESGQLRRDSLDLTRKLAEMRAP